jgi:hypothetical protein
MTTSEAPAEGRRRGGIRWHGEGWQARVSAGTDPSTGERIVLYETVPIPAARTRAARERAEREAFKEAQKVLTRLQAEADALKVGRTKATVGALLERWMEQHEIDPTTRMTYDAQIRLYIVPSLGDVPLVLFVREAAGRPGMVPGHELPMRLCPTAGASGCSCGVVGRPGSDDGREWRPP